jgi:hypothetical protein
VAQLIFLYNLTHSRFWGKPPPPPWDNFGGKLPIVYHDPFQYGAQSSVGDYVMQTSPEQVPAEGD